MPKPKPATGGPDDVNCPREFRKDYWKYTSNQPTWMAIIGAAAVMVSIAFAVLMPYAI